MKKPCQYCGNEFDTKGVYACHLNNCEKNPKNLRGSKHIYNPLTLERSMLVVGQELPDGWVYGTGTKKQPQVKQCPKCGIEHYKQHGKYCSYKCSNSRLTSKESKKNISEGLKKSFRTGGALKRSVETRVKLALESGVTSFQTCPVCENSFKVNRSVPRIYCSRECYDKDSEHKFRNIGQGGHREGSGRSHSGRYQGVYLNSTYELAYWIWCKDNGVALEKCDDTFTYELDGVTHTYHPDFNQDGLIIEIKGYHTNLVDIKADAVRRTGKEIRILYKEDIQDKIDWVKDRYKVKKLEQLYDNARLV